MFFIFIFCLILLEYNVTQDFKTHYTIFNIMPHNALTRMSHNVKHLRIRTLFVSYTTHGS
ncbi:hypothetical protein Hanom_Chr16g01448531 [Helianthus anomalus]